MMNMKQRVNVYILLLMLLGSLTSLVSCKNTSVQESEQFTQQDAIDKFAELSPTVGAQFYVDSRKQYPFLDTMYVENIVPIVKQCSFDTIKSVFFCVNETPASSALAPAYETKKKEYLRQIKEEIKGNALSQKKAFVDCVVPAMQVEIDSLLEEDMTNVMSKYSGGFLNWRKLKFWFGTNSDDFAKIWKENIDNDKYTNCVASYIDTYLDSLAVLRSNYYKDVVGDGEFESENHVDQATMDLLLAKKCVREVKRFTEKEKDEMTVSLLKDWVAPTVLGAFTGGVGTAVAWAYDAGNFAYDVKVTIDDIKAQKMDADDVVKYACMENIGFQIRQAYLKFYTERVFKNIDQNSKQLYEAIAINL